MVGGELTVEPRTLQPQSPTLVFQAWSPGERALLPALLVQEGGGLLASSPWPLLSLSLVPHLGSAFLTQWQ